MRRVIIIIRRLLYVIAGLFGSVLKVISLLLSIFEYILTGKVVVLPTMVEKYEHWCDYVLNPD